MKRDDLFDKHPAFVILTDRAFDGRYKRWNLALIAALAFLVAGVFAMAMTPKPKATGARIHHAHQV